MPAGRPRKPFDWMLVDSLIELNATEYWIATKLLEKEGKEINKTNIQTMSRLITRRIEEQHGMNFVDYRNKRLDGRRVQLSELQWRSAQDGNVTMQIWLGKQLLGQSDKQEVKQEVSQSKLVIEYSGGSNDNET